MGWAGRSNLCTIIGLLDEGSQLTVMDVSRRDTSLVVGTLCN